MNPCAFAVVGVFVAGCACPPQEYRAVPAWAIPAKPAVETVQASELQCLSDDAYLSLAERDRACWRYAGELRALLGPE